MSPRNLSVKNKIHNSINKILDKKNLKKLYLKFTKKFKIKSSFAVAVSGGPDSLALAFLSKVYAEKNRLITKYFIVDHKLRQNSTKEALVTKRLLRKLKINAKILTWKGKKPKSNIQAVARNKRYELLINECRKLKVNHLLLGHHADDKLENFLIRLTRGSGLRGLVSFSETSNLNGVCLERPLLDFNKKELIYLTSNIFKNFINDPSNENSDFKRVRLRKMIETLGDEGFSLIKLNKTIENLKFSDNTINFDVQENLKKNSFFSKKKQNFLLNQFFFKQPKEIVFRSLSQCIKEVGNKHYYSRGDKVLRLINTINSKNDFKTTLGGCMIKKINNTVIISKEI